MQLKKSYMKDYITKFYYTKVTELLSRYKSVYDDKNDLVELLKNPSTNEELIKNELKRRSFMLEILFYISALMTDIYTLSRVFKPTLNDTDIILIYFGNMHAENIREFLMYVNPKQSDHNLTTAINYPVVPNSGTVNPKESDQNVTAPINEGCLQDILHLAK